MSKTSLILEALFTGADEEECARRDAEAPKIMLQEWLEEFLKRNDITKNEDGSYNVARDVDLSNMKLQKIPIKFNKVGESFYCNFNQLTSLEGAPKTVGGNFWCYNNQLTSLEGSPKTVGANFWCYNNKKKFTFKDVRAVSKVRGYLNV